MDNTFSWDSMTHLFLLTKISDQLNIKFSQRNQMLIHHQLLKYLKTGIRK